MPETSETNPVTLENTLKIIRWMHKDTVTDATAKPESLIQAQTTLDTLNTIKVRGEEDTLAAFMKDAPGMNPESVARMVDILRTTPVPAPEKTPRFDPDKGLVMEDRDAFARHKQFLVTMLETLMVEDPTTQQEFVRRWNGAILPTFPPDEQPSHIMTISQLNSLGEQLKDVPDQDEIIDRIAIMAFRGKVDVKQTNPKPADITPAEPASGEIADQARDMLEQHAAAEPTEDEKKSRKEPRNTQEKRMVNVALLALEPALRNDVTPEQLAPMIRRANELLTWVNGSVQDLVDNDLLPSGIVDKIRQMPPAPPPQSSTTV